MAPQSVLQLADPLADSLLLICIDAVLSIWSKFTVSPFLLSLIRRLTVALLA